MSDGFEDLYQKAILERAARPLHAQRLAAFDATARGDNPMCGDRVQVWVRRDAQGRVAATGFEARGCKLCVASADLMADAVACADLAHVRALYGAFERLVTTGTSPDGADLSAAMATLRPLGGVHSFPSRIRCTTLPWSALIAALEEKGLENGGTTNE